MIRLHVAIELAGIIGNLDVYSRQPVIIVPRFAALVHASISGLSLQALLLSMSLAPSRRNPAGLITLGHAEPQLVAVVGPAWR